MYLASENSQSLKLNISNHMAQLASLQSPCSDAHRNAHNNKDEASKFLVYVYQQQVALFFEPQKLLFTSLHFFLRSKQGVSVHLILITISPIKTVPGCNCIWVICILCNSISCYRNTIKSSKLFLWKNVYAYQTLRLILIH